MKKLNQRRNSYCFTNIKKFNIKDTFTCSSIIRTLRFAYNMSFGDGGAHRIYRSGGRYKRKNGEIFINTFQGKLAELAIYNQLSTFFNTMKEPDLNTYTLGKWDLYDFSINDKKISVKSTSEHGQLLLLETKDWDNYGRYIPK